MIRLIKNSIITPDGTEIISRSVNDFITHKDKNGKVYSIDGGLAYCRRVGDMADCVDTSVSIDTENMEEEFETIRNNLSWGTYGVNGNQPLKYILIKDIETSHIQNILKHCKLTDFLLKVFEMELEYRGIKWKR